MDAKSIRRTFLEFFQSKQHAIVPSAPLVIKNDPTLMFTNAGMNQFKDYFLGNKAAENTRVTDTQKCLRVSGKHNDLEEVGIDTYHHTMFEMLGNWSFGDYFKKEAIEWAWELLTDVYGLPKDRLYVSVFEGDKEDGTELDQEAIDIWKGLIDEDRIIPANKKDNFWEMGETGPCGPCSEIHIDLRNDEERAKIDGLTLVNEDHPLVVEIWNLVFMQFNRKADGSLVSLPSKHIDTGMGFERLCMAIQKKESNYDTDVFQPMIQSLAAKSGKVYGEDEKIDIAIRVISDHIRAISFAIADGQLPSNNKAGYVIRRILRRAVRYGYTFLGFTKPFMYELVDILSEQFDEIFPELISQADFIKKVVMQEEAAFLRTLEKGLVILQKAMDGSDKVIAGKEAFTLYDTFGFPLDLTELIASENGFTVDTAGFDAAMKEQKDRARAASVSEKGDWIDVNEGDEVEFLGYDVLESDAQILRYREVTEKKKTIIQLVLDQTPFYAESGGQVGDKGILVSGEETIAIFDTKKENDLIIHFANKLPSNPSAPVLAKVDAHRRQLTENNHSATHLLHAALQEVLGEHVAQKGSLVNDKHLRFDFSHFQKVEAEELAQIEKIVNQRIRQNIPLNEQRNVPIDEAKDMGATALFGEKYGDFVRVITFDKDYSVELCGGTHVAATGQIGLLKITAESSVAAGVRRIEAITADAAEEFVDGQITLLQEIKELLKSKDPKKSVIDLVETKAALSKEVETLRNKELQAVKTELASKAIAKDGFNFIAEKVSVPNAQGLKQLAYDLKAVVDSMFLILAADVDGKPQVAVMIDEEVVKAKDLHAGNIVKALAKEIKGGGGGQPFFATAGGKDINGLDAVVVKAQELV
ncbi:alanine--tRNA ligase [Flammeovirga kamogawensis]|uniref:Alanine--tRNA ligase n=1 Tax=Flammeovirga kamogawensis TaxID=373891 RepID=A0ABX8GS79_9BACT|nr:alanine--tRNA ligase [Flammeovirga kamogawensis]MBB6462747.1 alanyl-tRNA synthetase [Flammeovirga kamogawensis]QWG06022.1 alanine--tRNA ligase [Flammeovirga kamogawensis]TRX67853.1 alanine--tRNA ligase [Flammeovirga kamogawensis]